MFAYERSRNIYTASRDSRFTEKMPGKLSPYKQALSQFVIISYAPAILH